MKESLMWGINPCCHHPIPNRYSRVVMSARLRSSHQRLCRFDAMVRGALWIFRDAPVPWKNTSFKKNGGGAKRQNVEVYKFSAQWKRPWLFWVNIGGGWCYTGVYVGGLIIINRSFWVPILNHKYLVNLQLVKEEASWWSGRKGGEVSFFVKVTWWGERSTIPGIQDDVGLVISPTVFGGSRKRVNCR